MSTYFAILTQVGEAKLANAIALGQTLKLKNLAVGDGNGNLPMPVRTQKALVREVRRAGLNQLTIDPANPSQIIVEQVLPEDVGGWWIREIGIFDEAGDLCAVANCPPSYKPLMLEGSGRTQVVRIVLIVASTAAIELKIDPSVILATRKYVDDQDITVRAYSDAQLAKHLVAADPHPQYSMKEVATLKKFDASKKLVNAEFVQQAQGSMVKFVGVGASRTLTADDMGAALYFTAPGLTLTIPSPDALGIPANSGKYFKLFGRNQAAGTIASAAGVVIAYDVSDVKNIVIKQGQFLTLMATAGQVWQVIDATAEMWRNVDFADYFNNTAPTQPQFDSSTKIATTEYANRIGMQASKMVVVGAGKYPLSKDDAGASFINNGVSGLGLAEFTLPGSRQCKRGTRIEFFCVVSVSPGMKVNVVPGDLLYASVAAIQSIDVNAGESLTVESDGLGNWVCVNGSAQLRHVEAFKNYFGNVVPTPEQFNSGPRIATTEFVRRAQGSMTGYTRVEADRSLTAEDAGSVLLLGGAAMVLTLPPPVSLGIPNNAGICVRVHCTGPQSARLVPAKGAFLMAPDETNSITVKKGQSLTMMATTDQVWRVIDSTAELSRNAAFSGVLAGSGHKFLPDDFIMQWQTVDVPVATTGIATKNFSFPVAFKEAAFGCTASVLGVGASPNSNAFVAAMPTSVNGGVAQNNYTNSNVSVFIISIGK